MITAINKTLISLLAGCVLAIAAPFASASTWNFGTVCNMPTANGHGKVWQCTGTPAVDVAAWSTTGAGSTFATATAALYSGGFGVKNQSEGDTSPNHSMDNETYTDLLAFSFNQSVELDKITIGWSQYDADISLLAYQGTNAPASIEDKSASELVGLGWTIVGNYGNAASDTLRIVTVNANNISSKYWLISSYNALYDSTKGSFDITKDYVKILGVEGVRTPVKVPEPSPLALIAVAMFALYAIRRRDGQRG